jgi:Tfp pilus assembly protein PilF
MQGDLDRKPAAAVVRELFAEARSGVLALQNGSVGCNICVQDGRLIFATSNLKRFQLASWLETSKVVTARSVMEAQGEQQGTKGLVEALVASLDIDRVKLVTAIRQLLKEIVVDAVGWDEGTFRFTPGSPVLRNDILLDVPTLAILREVTGDLTVAATSGDTEDEGAGDDSPGSADGFAKMDASPPDASRDGAPAPAPEAPEVRAFRQRVAESEGKNFYDLLGVPKSADEETVRKSYYHLARDYHPDAMQGPVAEACWNEVEEYFASVTEAYNTLTRPQLRKEYDEQLKAGRGMHDEKNVQDPATLAKQNFEQGRRSFAAGEFHDATQFFRNAVRLVPDCPDYHRELGIVQMQNPRWQKAAEESLRQAVELQPADARALVHLGMLYQSNGLKKRAVDAFREALNWDPVNEAALAGLAEVQSGKGDDDGSRRKGLFGRR